MAIRDIEFQLDRMRELAHMAAGADDHQEHELALELVGLLIRESSVLVERLKSYRVMMRVPSASDKSPDSFPAGTVDGRTIYANSTTLGQDRLLAEKPIEDFFTDQSVSEFLAEHALDTAGSLPVDPESWRKELRYEDHGESRGFFVLDKHGDYYLDCRSMQWVPARSITDDIMFPKKWIAKSAINQCVRPPVPDGTEKAVEETESSNCVNGEGFFVDDEPVEETSSETVVVGNGEVDWREYVRIGGERKTGYFIFDQKSGLFLDPNSRTWVEETKVRFTTYSQAEAVFKVCDAPPATSPVAE